MKIYHYSEETGMHIGTGDADADPLVQGEFLIPAYATTKKPEAEREGFTQHFDGDKWVYREIPPPPPEPEPEQVPEEVPAQEPEPEEGGEVEEGADE